MIKERAGLVWPAWRKRLGLGLLAGLGLVISVLIQAASIRSEVETYLSHWEEEIAKNILMDNDGRLLGKLLGHVARSGVHLRDVQSAQKSAASLGAAPAAGLCYFDFAPSLTLYGLPAAKLEFCLPVVPLLQKTVLGPAFLGFLILLLGFSLFFRHENWRSETEKKILAQKLQTHAELSRISRQVAHDIRSPLSALQTLVHLAHEFDGNSDFGRLLKNAVARIKAISDDLHERGKWSLHGETRLDHLIVAVEQIHRELAIVFPGQRLETRHLLVLIGEPSLRVPFKPEVWQRLLMNLIKNAFESQVKAGRSEPVLLLIDKYRGDLRLRLQDKGVGAGAEILRDIGREGFSHGKVDGTGLGFSFGRTLLESVGGSLVLESKGPGQGANVILRCPFLQSQNQVLSRENA